MKVSTSYLKPVKSKKRAERGQPQQTSAITLSGSDPIARKLIAGATSNYTKFRTLRTLALSYEGYATAMQCIKSQSSQSWRFLHGLRDSGLVSLHPGYGVRCTTKGQLMFDSIIEQALRV